MDGLHFHEDRALHFHEDRALHHLVNQSVSKAAHYASLILTLSACVLAVLRIYFLDLFLIPRAYPKRVLSSITDAQRRSFVNHHVAAATKILLLIITAYPFIAIMAGHATPHTPFFRGSRTTLGDVLIISSQIFTVMYIFELFYRDKVSPISCAHHVGAITIAQVALAMTIDERREKDAIYEFMICFVWGAFDVIAELWPHISMIVYRVYNDDHKLLYRIFYGTMILELVGTTVETIVVMWLFGSLWDKWSRSLKIVTPFLHLLFSAAQLWGAWIFYKMAMGQKRDMDKQRKANSAGSV